MAPARTSARNSQIPGRETPGQVWVRVAFFQDLSMWLKVTQNPMLFKLPLVSQVQRLQAPPLH